MDEYLLMTLLVVMANGVFDAVVVAWLAGRRSKQALVSYLNSGEALPYMDQIASRAKLAVIPEISGMENRIMTALDSKIKTIRGDIHAEMDSFETPEIPEIPTLEQIRAEFSTVVASQTTDLKAEILESIKMSEQGMQSALNRQVSGQLKSLGIDAAVSDLGEAIQNEAIASGTAKDMILAKVMGVQISPKFAKDNPVAALLIETGRAALLQQVQQMMPGANQNISSNQSNTTAIKTSPFG